MGRGAISKLSRAALVAACAAACMPPSFEPPSKVRSVRILAARADKPYAKPGAEVNMELLAVDGRPEPSVPMQVYWLPGACFNPPGDRYYACFAGLDQVFVPGMDLGPRLREGPEFSFVMPDDIIETHVGDRGSAPYGLAVVFAIACAGRVQYVPQPANGSPDAVPFGCFDVSGTRLSARDFVFSYSLIYSFEDRTNENPEIESLTFRGKPVDLEQGIEVGRCTESEVEDCPENAFDVTVPRSSHEVDHNSLDAQGRTLREQIYVKYYMTGGQAVNDTVILYDPREGRLSDTDKGFFAPRDAGQYRLWAVVHDNRGGVNWWEVPMTVN